MEQFMPHFSYQNSKKMNNVPTITYHVNKMREIGLYDARQYLGLSDEDARMFQAFYPTVYSLCQRVNNPEFEQNVLEDIPNAPAVVQNLRNACQIHEHEGALNFPYLMPVIDKQTKVKKFWWAKSFEPKVDNHHVIYYTDDDDSREDANFTSSNVSSHYKTTGFEEMNRALIVQTKTDPAIKRLLRAPPHPLRRFFTEDYVFLNSILELPRSRYPFRVYRHLGRFSSLSESLYQKGKIVPIDMFLSTGLSPQSKNCGGDPQKTDFEEDSIFISIKVPAMYPFYSFYTAEGMWEMRSLETSEILLPYTTDHSGQFLTHGLHIIDDERNKQITCVDGSQVKVQRFMTAEIVPLPNPVPVQEFPVELKNNDPTIFDKELFREMSMLPVGSKEQEDIILRVLKTSRKEIQELGIGKTGFDIILPNKEWDLKNPRVLEIRNAAFLYLPTFGPVV